MFGSCRPISSRLALWAPILALVGGPIAACAPPPPKKQNVAQNPVDVDGVGPTRIEAGKTGLGMFAEEPILQFQVSGETERVKREVIDVEEMPFDKALRLTVTESGQDPWTMQVLTPTRTNIEVGDVLLASFWIRTERSENESGEGQTAFVLELAKDPWSKSVEQDVRAGRKWQQVHIPFQARQTHYKGEAQVIFRLGYGRQTLEIGGLELHNFRRELTVDQLPKTKITYDGREPDAPWREAAQERINKHRKGPLIISVVDADGNPVPNAEVDLQQLTHEFWFGTALVAPAVVHAEENRTYLAKTLQHFNSIVLENNLKWKPLAGDWGPTWGIESATTAIDWARSNGLRTRGHVLVWPSWRNLPNELKKLENDKKKLKVAVEDHVRDLATKMAGRLEHWDVLNEPYDNHDLMDILGDEVMVDWFKIAKKADPKAKLFINDYSILSGGGGPSGHRDHYEKTIRYLVEQGAPLDGIGMQGHFGSSLTSPDDLMEILDRFAGFERPILITEYDITADDPELAADYTRDFYTLLFSHPSVEGIFMWGFFDGKHWKRSGTLYDSNWNLKKSGQAYQDLVFGKWWTSGRVKTDESGRVLVRGFLGEYDIKPASGGVSKRVKLGKEGANVSLIQR